MKNSNDLRLRSAPSATSLTASDDPEKASVQEEVRALPGWYLADRRRTLGVKYRFSENRQALEFLATLSKLANEHDATPHLVLTAGGQLHLRLRSRQPGGVSQEELDFARAVANAYPGGPRRSFRLSLVAGAAD